MIIAKAILKINPKAKVIVRGDDIDTCEIEWVEATTPISKEDIKKQIPIVEAEIQQEQQDAIDNKTSAHNKLKALGLTDAEIKAL